VEDVPVVGDSSLFVGEDDPEVVEFVVILGFFCTEYPVAQAYDTLPNLSFRSLLTSSIGQFPPLA
jgi:hypothetical protein